MLHWPESESAWQENLVYFAALHHLDPGTARRRIDRLLEQVGLVCQADSRSRSTRAACASASTSPAR
jgi:hypothetical protein